MSRNSKDMAKILTLKEKFLSRVNKTETCWLWIGYRNTDGYGVIHLEPHVKKFAHRVSYTLFINPVIPDGAHVLHSCDNPSCVNPSHLRIGTHYDNMSDMVSRGRSLKGENHNLSKLNVEDIKEIRLLSKAGMKSPEIAKIFKVTESNVRHIVRRVTWKHV